MSERFTPGLAPDHAIPALADRPSSRPSPRMALGAMMLATSMSTLAQTAATADQVMPAVEVKGARENEAKESIRTSTSSIGKGQQSIRDIPQSINVMTEKLMDDAKLTTLREALHYSAGITFAATENGTDQDIRLRGFPVATTGDLLIDGMRDPSQYDRDTFNVDRVEVMRGSASMLFGRGSTGGVINQVTKKPFLSTQHEVMTTVGSHGNARVTGDFNFKTGENEALRLNVMRTKAGNKGAEVDKFGIAPTYSWGIGTRDEVSLGFFHLETDNVPMAGVRYLGGTVPDLNAGNFYGTNSDYVLGTASYATASHIHRFGEGAELRSQLRVGQFDRSQWGTTASFAAGTTPANLTGSTRLNLVGLAPRKDQYRGTYLQSDYNDKYNWFGLEHKITAGIDAAVEEADRYGAYGAVTTNFNKGSTTAGNPDAGLQLNAIPTFRPNSAYSAQAIGLYAQDLVQIAPAWKLLGGIRFDHFNGRFRQIAYPIGGAPSETTTSLSESPFSYRGGVLYQPTDRASFHFSYGTSFNTSADTYQFVTAQNANTPPEKSRNIELGAKLDWLDGKLSTRAAIFHTEKFNERTTDADFAGSAYLLSGRRHSQGIELDVVGRLTRKLELYLSYSLIPTAVIDQIGSAQANVVGSRVGLTPRQSGAAWLSYQVTPQLRVAGGLHGASQNRPLQGTSGAASTTAQAPGYVVGDLMAEYVFNEKYTAQLNVNNVANRNYGDQLYPGFVITGAPRTALLSLIARF
ncbi:TonB-dependent receptor [Lacisediminimonas profundi]|uniref:TonB-dependent receptor n=1 Tax=Lacisediminimonas profundi TaxID=2603856 RepID=UPI001F4FDC93|nr:TonB-dependent siderophore receptor [Lacisediminimonas profundi]